MGLVSGGLTTLATGSLKKGLGAGLTTGLIGGMMAPGTAAPTDAVKTVTPALEGVNQAASNAIANATPPAFSTDSFFNQIPTGASPVASTVTQAPSVAPSFSSSVYPNYTPIPMSGGAVSSLGSTMSPEQFNSIQQSGLAGAKNVPTGLWDKTSNWWKNSLTPNERLMYGIGGVGALGVIGDAMTPKQKEVPVDKGSIRPYTYASTTASPSPYPTGPMYNAAGNPILSNKEQRYFNQGYTELPAYKAADGGLMAAGGLSNMYPQSQQYSNDYASSIQAPMGNEVLDSGYEQRVGQYTGEPLGYSGGGIADLGDYSDGGRLLRGPGDGVSDSIPASIGGKQPARLADGEFVIPARIVSELGNGSTDAGAKRLYAMMDKIQSGRKKTIGKGKVAVDSKAAKHLPK
jgi:hypothetical protein